MLLILAILATLGTLVLGWLTVYGNAMADTSGAGHFDWGPLPYAAAATVILWLSWWFGW